LAPIARRALPIWFIGVLLAFVPVSAFAAANAAETAWRLTACPDGTVGTVELGEEAGIALVAQCDANAQEPDGGSPVLCAESPQIRSTANWYLRFRLHRGDPAAELRVDLVDASADAGYSVVLDPGSCRLLHARSGFGPRWTEVDGREWMNTSWWLDEEHGLELRYHASPQTVSVRFDWNYCAFVYDAPVAIETETFAYLIHVASAATPASGTAFEPWEFALEERPALDLW